MWAAVSMPEFFPDQPQSSLQAVDADDAIDVALMREVARGDEKAFRSLILRHQQAVVGTVSRMLNDPIEAEDIAQMVFVRVWQSAPKWTHDAKFTTYLFTITRNLVFNESRRRGRKKEVSLESHEEHQPAIARADEAMQPGETLEKRELHRSIDRAIASLPEQQRMAVILRTFEGLDYEEIAQALDTSVSSVKSLLFRARATLRDALAGEMDSA
ncbi:MAG: RNA polymerase sigma factor [Akkermansiaceae bacterium]